MNAALSPLLSAMAQLYRAAAHAAGRIRPRARHAVVRTAASALIAASLAGVSLHAQVAQRPPLGSTITVDALGMLPAAGNLFSILDTAIPDVIADRIDTGGLSAGEPARIGAHGSTWTQTLFTLGDADITDPTGSGKPLLVPGVETWQRVAVATGMMPLDLDAPGLAVALTPRPPTAQWSGLFHGIVSPPALNAKGDVGRRPSITRLNSWFHGELVAAGPINSEKLAAFSSISATRSTHFERASPAQIDANVASAFFHFTSTPRSADSLRLIAWLQRARDPVANHRALQQPNAGERDVALHAQASWAHLFGGGSTSLRGYGAISDRRRENNLISVPFIAIERLRDGPIPNVLDVGPGRDRTWSAGARLHAGTQSDGSDSIRHDVIAGVDVMGAQSTMQSTFTGSVGELVDGIPARLWTFVDPIESSQWRSLQVAAFVGDEIALAPRVTVNAGLRAETISGAREGDSSPAITWRSLQPRAGAHVALTNFWHIAAIGQFGRYGHRLPLRDLAYGDPTAPTGSVFRWNAPVGATELQPGAIGPLVQRMGPGTGGNAAFSSIDPDLKRPMMNELILGFEARPRPSAIVRFVAIGRREKNLVGVADVGVPKSTYSTIGVFDTGVDLVGASDDFILNFYNRAPSTFGADRYLLTNPSDNETSFVGADLTGWVEAKNGAYLSAGITAGRSEALSGNRGFGPLENDAGVLGEVFIDPNARDHAQGRVFTERGYTLKIGGAKQFGRGVDFAMIARYQDGQHFARLVINDTLNQGAEAVRAFRNGRTRFTFSMTVDARLQKTFTAGGHRISAMVDAYNMFNQALEVEEFSVTGAQSRLTTAVQPPRVVQLGVRIPF